ncbi:hypothetical protein H4R33_004469 [Dimargaris cristalligena]|nr:hypothetical protein H4R33_004469 [Dimargaris cristalligena]
MNPISPSLHMASRIRAFSTAPRLAQRASSVIPSVPNKPRDFQPPTEDSYVPGVCGYAPGFAPPKNWPRNHRAKKPPMTLKDLPKPSQRQSAPVPAQATPEKAYRLEMTKIRYEYRARSLGLADRRRHAAEKAQRAEVERVEAAQTQKAAERQEFQTRVARDPFSAENLLNAEGSTIMKDAPIESKLVQSFSTPEDKARFLADRHTRRQQNRRDVDAHYRRELRARMVDLFYNAQHFVTRDNIDDHLQRIAMEPAAQSPYLLGAEENGGDNADITSFVTRTTLRDFRVQEVSPDMQSRRMDQLEAFMNGVDGNGRLGMDAFEQGFTETFGHEADAADSPAKQE